MRKTLFMLAAVFMLLASLGFGQSLTSFQVNGMYQPAAFSGYTMYAASAVASAGASSMSVTNTPYGAGVVVGSGCYLPTQGFGAIQWTPIMVGNQLTILDANAETVTITAASAAPTGLCTFTATFSNTHNAGAPIVSGTNGYQDAVTYAKFNGGGVVAFSGSELLTLSTGGTTTDTAAFLLPATSYIDTVSSVVNTTIAGGCTGWAIGDATTAARFSASNTTLTAGTASVGSVASTTGVASATTGVFQAAAAKVRVTCATAAPSAGKVRVVVSGRTVVAPAS